VPAGEQVLDPRAAYMISSILSDPAAKLFTYGRQTPLILKDRPAASKTGTTDNVRDTWTDGYTPNLAIVVWVGNTDGHPMKQALSTMTAGKIWPQAMQAAIEYLGLPPEDFPRPEGLVDQQVCGDQAMRPGEPRCRNDLFFAGQAPQLTATVAATAAPTAQAEPTAASEPTQPPAAATAAPAVPAKPQATAAPAPAKPQATAVPAPAKPQATAVPAPAKPQPTAVPALPKPTVRLPVAVPTPGR
jgi:membrane peptidoglycan carboxypeptidase